jgi:ATP-dependent Clp protease ATP-binding subunit ClpC
MSKRLTEKFTERAKKALSKAAKEALGFGSSFIDTEHVLLGILDDETSVASKVISSFRIEREKIRESVVASIENAVADEESNKNEEGFSESCQEAIAAAALQAYLWGNSYVGTEHLLCGLAKTPSGLACHILRSWGVTYDTLRSRVEGYTTAQPTKEQVKDTSTPLLNTYSRDLTSLADSGKLDPVIHRDEEISRLIQVLARRTKNNPVLLGEAGVGKTAIVEGLAQRIVEKKVPQRFFGTRLISLDINSLVAGTRFRGDFEERLLGVLEEIRDAGNVIIFIDEIQTIVGAGGAGGALDAANILKPALARGELSCIGATTSDEYAAFIEEDSALERRFQPIYVDEPDTQTSISILEGLKERYESHHGIRFKKGAINAAVRLAKRYLVDRHLPDSAIDVLDEAASRKVLIFNKLPTEAVDIDEKIKTLATEKDRFLKKEDWGGAIRVRNLEERYLSKLETILAKQEGSQNTQLEESDITQVVSQMTGIPVKELTRTEAEKLLNLELELGEKVIGQNHVLREIATVLRRSRVGLKDPDRPMGSFIFLGTSGVGKTLVAESLAQLLFDDPTALIRFDMSEFSEKHTVARLIGAPPGYVGFEEGGEITEKLRHRPFSVILLDEIEKAHPELFNILLQVLDNGQLTDGRGKTINFRNSLIIMTSNIGSHLIKREGDLGFGKGKKARGHSAPEYREISQKLKEELKKSVKVEYLNRIDSVLVFKQLDERTVRKITKLLLKELADRLKEEQKMTLRVESKVLDDLVRKGFSPEFGAREMKRVVAENIEIPLSEKILRGELQKGQKVRISFANGVIVIK